MAYNSDKLSRSVLTGNRTYWDYVTHDYGSDVLLEGYFDDNRLDVFDIIDVTSYRGPSHFRVIVTRAKNSGSVLVETVT